EPLSALDLKLRQHMRAELRQIQQTTGVTFIYITHDQGEALTMSDRIAVMNAGQIEQVGTGDEIYSTPASPFVASFVGEANIFRGRVEALDGEMAYVETRFGRFLGRNTRGLAPGDGAMLFVRPENVGLSTPEAPYGNQLDATLARRDLEGPFVNVVMRAGDRDVAMHLRNEGDGGQRLIDATAGGVARIGFACEQALVLPEGELARTGREETA
ncbi:MAG: ABC transporter ATP-binding protein, partial [Pseudomonadota bacterium]